MLNTPNFIGTSGVRNAAVTFKWDRKLAAKFYSAEDQNQRLADALQKASYRAQVAVGIAITEWILWRFEGQYDLTDGLRRSEAAWAAVINPAYAKSLEFTLSRGIHDTQFVQGAIEVALGLLEELHERYTKGSIYVVGTVVRLATLARHVTPDKKVFDAWLSEALRRAATYFPAEPQTSENGDTFDPSSGKPIPREFFSPTVEYTDAAATGWLQTFLRGLNAQENPYLRSSDELKAQGFKGTPYSL